MNIIKFTSRNFLGLSLLSWAFGLSLSLAFAVRDRSLENFIPWKMAQYYVNYFELGFVKRGMLGTLLYPIMKATNDDRFLAITFVVLLDLAVVLAGLALIQRVFDREPLRDKMIGDVVKFILVFSPVGIMQLSYDVGRFDHVTTILAIISLFLILKGSTFLAGLLFGIGVLIHEAVFVFAFPVLLMILIVVHNGRRPFRISVLSGRFSITPVACAAAVLLFGNTDADLSSILPAWVDRGMEVWQRGLFEPSSNLTEFQYATLAFYALTPSVFLIHFYRSNRLPLDSLFLATWFTLLLFWLGIDYSRWCHLIFVSNCLVIMFHLTQGRCELRTDSRLVNTLFFAYALPLGPLGTDDLLPYVEIFLRMFLGSSWLAA